MITLLPRYTFELSIKQRQQPNKINNQKKQIVMKKLFFAALIATTVATSSFATDANKINFRIMQAFKSEYSNAANVNWTLRSTYAKATFQKDGQPIDVFYNLSGELIGISRQISIDDLPTNAKRIFAKKYAGYNVKEAIIFESEEEKAFYISAGNEQESVILKVSDIGSLSIYKKDRKN